MKMRAVILDEFGDEKQLHVRQMARPEPAPHEVLVHVRACGICHLDLILRSGMRSRVKLPRILGHELAGYVVAIGEGVSEFSVGDRVASFNYQSCEECEDCLRGRPSLCRHSRGDIGQTCNGGYAEYAALPASNLVVIPSGMPFEHACFAACVFSPPYKAIKNVGNIKAGQWVVVTGASGGLGIAALQILNRLGAHSIAITSDQGKVDRLKKLGAKAVIVSRDGKFGDEVRAITRGRGVDLVLELIGSPTFDGSLRSLAPGGRIAVIGELSGTPIEMNLGLLIIKEFELHGVQSASRDELQEVLTFIHESGIEPVIWKTISLDEVAQAHRELHGREVIGRIVIAP